MEIDFSSLDYSAMMVDTFGLQPKQDPRVVYPESFAFSEYYEDTHDVDIKKVLRYIPLVYDRNSPLHKIYTDLRKLKIKAADLAGFIRQEDGKFLSNVEAVLMCANTVVNKMIIRYVTQHKNALYVRFVMYNELYLTNMEAMLAGKTNGKVSDFDALGDKLDEIRQQLFSQDKSPKLHEDLQQFYFDDRLFLKPEDIAKKLQEKPNESPVPIPEKKKPEEVSKKILNQYEKEDEWVVINDDPTLHPVYIKQPQCPDITQIQGYGLPASEQFWVPPEVPFKLKYLIHESERIEDIWATLEANQADYRKEIRWIQDQIYYSLYGYWFFNNGKPTYLCGWHYDYLTHWRFGGDITPEYRDRDRKWYHGVYYAYTTTEYPATDKHGRLVYKDKAKRILKMIDAKRKTFLGYIGPKGRRAGDSNKFLCAMYMETQRHKGKNSGIISSSGEHAKKKLFDEIVVPGWQQMPFFYKPVTSSNENPDKEIKFVGSRKKAGAAKISEQLKSKIDYSPTSESTHYDGGKQFFLDCDEAGKSEVDVYARHQELKECVSQGSGINIVGFMGYPSTVGEMEAGGGKLYAKLCKDSWFEKRSESGQTTTGLLLVYISCLEGLEGFVDRYGNSVIDDPTPEQAKFIGKNFGSRKHIMSMRKSYLDNNDNDGYNGYVRLFPIYYKECFRTADGDIGFNTVIINERLDELAVIEKELVRTGNFEWENGQKYVGRVVWRDDPKGRWVLSQLLHDTQTNRFTYTYINGMSQKVPVNPKHVTCTDPFKQSKVTGSRMSDGGIGTVYDFDPEVDNANEDPRFWKSYRVVCTYRNRPATTSDFYDDALMQIVYFGSWWYPEINIADCIEWAHEKGFAGYFLYDIDWKTGKYKSVPGFSSQSPSKQSLFNVTRDYIETRGHKECHVTFLNECKDIQDMSEMTDYDLFTACAGALLGCKSKMPLFAKQATQEVKKLGIYKKKSY
jgi:hypothetical protein